MFKIRNTIFIRLSFILTFSIIASLLISNSLWWLFISYDEKKNTQYEISYLADEIKEYINQLNALPQAQRESVLNTLNNIGESNYTYGNVYSAELDHKVSYSHAIKYDEKETEFLSRLLNASLNRPISIFAINDVIEEADYSTEDEESNENLYNETLLGSILTSLLLDEETSNILIVIQTQLDDKQWLTLYTTPLSERTHLADILSPLNIIIILCSLPFIIIVLFIAVRWVNAPLSRLAKNAESIGRDILLKPKSLNNSPLEIQKIESALDIMQDRIINQITHSNEAFTAMSHDLKTPLTRMRIRAEMLDNPIIKDKFIEDIDRLEKMITGALNYIKQTEVKEEKCLIDMNALISSISDDARDLGGEVTIQGVCNDYFLGYPQALRSCFTNLIENAIFYGQKAEVEIINLDSAIQITIMDSGPGIPKEDLKKVLTPYYRVDESRNLNTGGSGLGLSIANKAIQAHMGELAINNRKDLQGLNVEVTLPF